MVERDWGGQELQNATIQAIHEALEWLQRVGTPNEMENYLLQQGRRIAIPQGRAYMFAIAVQEEIPFEHPADALIDVYHQENGLYIRRFQKSFVDEQDRSPYVQFVQEEDREGELSLSCESGWSDPFEHEIASALLQHTRVLLRVG